MELISRGKLVMARARFFAGAAEQGLEELDEWLASLQGPGYERVFALGMGCKVQFLLWLRRPNEAQRIYMQLSVTRLRSPSNAMAMRTRPWP